jgi:hypothetical protein
MSTDFFKLYFAAGRSTPPNQLYIFYGKRPLYRPAVFERDRYRFGLPQGLAEKMMAGDLIADFCYSELPVLSACAKPKEVPCSIILSNRD